MTDKDQIIPFPQYALQCFRHESSCICWKSTLHKAPWETLHFFREPSQWLLEAYIKSLAWRQQNQATCHSRTGREADGLMLTALSVSLHPHLCTLHPASLHPVPLSLHPASCISAPSSLHPVPSSLHPASLRPKSLFTVFLDAQVTFILD